MAMFFRATTVLLKRASLPTQWSPAFISHVAHSDLLYDSMIQEIELLYYSRDEGRTPLCVSHTVVSCTAQTVVSCVYIFFCISHVAHTHTHECNSKHECKLTLTPTPPTQPPPARLPPSPSYRHTRRCGRKSWPSIRSVWGLLHQEWCTPKSWTRCAWPPAKTENALCTCARTCPL